MIALEEKIESSKIYTTLKGVFSKPVYSNLFSLIVIILTSILIYSNIFNNTFHFDDMIWKEHPEIKGFDDIVALFKFSKFRIISFLTLMLNYKLDNLNPTGYYIFNLSIHIITSIFVWLVARCILRTPALKETGLSKHFRVLSLIVALIFVAHPLQTSAVTYIYQRLASIAGLFYFTTLFFYLKARLSQENLLLSFFFFLLTIFSLALAIFSKENTFTLPIMFLVLEIFLFSKKLKIRYILFALIFIGIGVLLVNTVLSLDYIFEPLKTYDNQTITSSNYFITQIRVIMTYYRLIFLPINQNLDYYYPIYKSILEPQVLLSLIGHIIIITSALILIKKNRLVAFGVFFFYIALAVESSVIPILDVIFEHRVYIPIFGIIIATVSMIFILTYEKYKYYAVLAFLIVFVTLSISAHQRNKVWKNDYTLWTNVIKNSPKNPRAYNIRGLYFFNRGRYDLAIKDFSKAIRSCPAFLEPYSNRGITYYMIQDYEKALLDFNEYIKFNETNPAVFQNRANVYLKLFQNDSVIKDINRMQRYTRGTRYSYKTRATAYYNKKFYKQAIKDFLRAIELEPNHHFDNKYCGLAYYRRGEYEEALPYLEKAIRIESLDYETMEALAESYFHLSEYEKAIPYYEKVMILKPQNTIAANNLKISRNELKKLNNANKRK